jgi:CRISPR-associated negative auto-regulator DevR/Csa2
LNPAFRDKEQEFVDNGKKVKRKAVDSEVMTKMISECSLTDLAGALVTRGRSVGRKSIVEFGWVVGLPEDGDGQPLTTTEQYFHVSMLPKAAALRQVVIVLLANRLRGRVSWRWWGTQAIFLPFGSPALSRCSIWRYGVACARRWPTWSA